MREREKSKPGIKTRLSFLKNITEEGDFENFQDLVVALDIKKISISEGEILADFRWRFPAFAVLIYICLSQSERDLYFVLGSA